MIPSFFLPVFISIFFLFSGTGWASEIDRTHWDRAVETAEKNRCWIPETILSTEKIRDTREKTVSTRVTRLKMTRKKGGRPQIILVSHMDNGQDKTAQFKSEFNQMASAILEELAEGSLFQKKMGPEIRLTGLEVREDTALYTFHFNSQGLAFQGRAKIDIRTGAAIHSRVRCKKMDDPDYEIKNYEEIIQYNNDPARWYPARITETLDLRAKSIFSSFKGRLTDASILSGYTCVKDGS